MDFFKDALVEVDEAIDAADDAVKRLVVANNRLVVANNRLKELRIVLLTKLRPKEQGLTLLSLPPEIRNMIYRYVMVSSRCFFLFQSLNIHEDYLDLLLPTIHLLMQNFLDRLNHSKATSSAPMTTM